MIYMCESMGGTPQDRQCGYSDYYWGGIPGALGEAFMAAYAGKRAEPAP